MFNEYIYAENPPTGTRLNAAKTTENDGYSYIASAFEASGLSEIKYISSFDAKIENIESGTSETSFGNNIYITVEKEYFGQMESLDGLKIYSVMGYLHIHVCRKLKIQLLQLPTKTE